MIYDKIENIDRYAGLAHGVGAGLRFVAEAAETIAPGRHELGDGNYANVDMYTTKENNPVGYEAHRRYIDIQYLVQGSERVRVRPLETLCCTTPYDEGRDVAFFADEGGTATEVVLGAGYFVVLFPNDAHEPQLCVEEPAEVKKIVVKVALDNE